jgi:hypothetical protein
VIAILAALSPAALAEEAAVKRTPVRKAYVERTGPELSTDSELATPAPSEPSALDEAIEEYYREQAEYYRQQRMEGGRSSGAACMYGPDGKVIHSPRGKSCGATPPQPTRP